MKIIPVALLVLLPIGAQVAWSGDLTTDAAIGGAIGGALGGVVGSQVGGRQGAILGAGVGGATGAAISTQGDRDGRYYKERPSYEEHRHYEYDNDYDRPSHFCPPGQAKKGRC